MIWPITELREDAGNQDLAICICELLLTRREVFRPKLEDLCSSTWVSFKIDLIWNLSPLLLYFINFGETLSVVMP